MTSKEFVIWLKGFTKAANSYNVTPAQWDAIIEELNKVKDRDHTTTTPQPYFPGPLDPYKVTCESNGTRIAWYSTDTNSIKSNNND